MVTKMWFSRERNEWSKRTDGMLETKLYITFKIIKNEWFTFKN